MVAGLRGSDCFNKTLMLYHLRVLNIGGWTGGLQGISSADECNSRTRRDVERTMPLPLQGPPQAFHHVPTICKRIRGAPEKQYLVLDPNLTSRQPASGYSKLTGYS